MRTWGATAILMQSLPILTKWLPRVSVTRTLSPLLVFAHHAVPPSLPACIRTALARTTCVVTPSCQNGSSHFRCTSGKLATTAPTTVKLTINSGPLQHRAFGILRDEKAIGKTGRIKTSHSSRYSTSLVAMSQASQASPNTNQ